MAGRRGVNFLYGSVWERWYPLVEKYGGCEGFTLVLGVLKRTREVEMLQGEGSCLILVGEAKSCNQGTQHTLGMCVEALVTLASPTHASDGTPPAPTLVSVNTPTNVRPLPTQATRPCAASSMGYLART